MIAFCLLPMVGAQLLIARGTLSLAVAVPGSVAIALLLGAFAGRRLLVRPRPAVVQPDQAERQRLAGQLVSDVAHDSNNLLATVLGCLELMDRRLGDPDRLLQLLTRATGAVERAAKLNSELVQFARRQPQAPRPTDVNARVVHLAPLISSALGRGIRLSTDLAADLGPVQVDAAGLEAAVLGMCFALRAALVNEGLIELRTRGETVPRPGVRLTFAVTGPGGNFRPRDFDVKEFQRTAASAGAVLDLRWLGTEGGGAAEMSLLMPSSAGLRRPRFTTRGAG